MGAAGTRHDVIALCSYVSAGLTRSVPCCRRQQRRRGDKGFKMSKPAWMRLGKIRVRPRRRALGLERQQQRQVGSQGAVTGHALPIVRSRGIEAEIDDSTSFAPWGRGTPALAPKNVSPAGAHRRNRPADVRAASLRLALWGLTNGARLEEAIDAYRESLKE
jgi:hypothetical protein